MKKILLLIILGLLISLLLTGCSGNQKENNKIRGHVLLSNTAIEEEFALPGEASISTATNSTQASHLAGSKNYIANQIIVKFKDVRETEDLLYKYNLSVKKEIKELNAIVVSGVGAQDTKELVDQLNSEAEVEYAELNGRSYINSSQLNPDATDYFEHQWHYSALSLPEAWPETTDSNAITVAVVDTGIDTNHPELEGQLDLQNRINIINSDIAENEIDRDVTDRNGHGTHGATCCNMKSIA